GAGSHRDVRRPVPRVQTTRLDAYSVAQVVVNQMLDEEKGMNHIGNCFCGAVEIEARGAPEAMGYCHCRSCRSWSGPPVNAFSLWKPEAVRVTAGEEHVATFTKTPASERKYCKKSAGHPITTPPPPA